MRSIYLLPIFVFTLSISNCCFAASADDCFRVGNTYSSTSSGHVIYQPLSQRRAGGSAQRAVVVQKIDFNNKVLGSKAVPFTGAVVKTFSSQKTEYLDRKILPKFNTLVAIFWAKKVGSKYVRTSNYEVGHIGLNSEDYSCRLSL